MVIETIGIITLLTGVLVLRKGPDFGIYVLMISTLLGAAAAVKLPALGGANILPAHALLPFYLLAVARQPGGIAGIMGALAFPRPGFWLAIFVAYGFVSAFILSRIFAGVVDVVAIDREAGGIYIIPLAPGSGNITQPVYLVGDFVLYAAVVAHAVRGSIASVVKAFLLAGIVNLCFGVLDMATYFAGMSSFLDFIRNANYGMLVEGEIEGFKRIVGSFTEASAFGAITLMYFVFAFELWLRRVHQKRAGVLAAVSFLAVLACTSSSAYVALGAYLAIFLLRCIFNLLRGSADKRDALIALLGPICLLVVLLVLMLIPSVWNTLTGFVDRTLVNKLSSQSGVERSMWNELGMRVFYDSAMLGVGVGSVRTSSFLVAVLACTGLFGAVTLGIYMLGIGANVFRRKLDSFAAAAAAAGGSACFILFATASLAGASVDLGLPFFAAAGLISAAANRRVAVLSEKDHPIDKVLAAKPVLRNWQEKQVIG